MYKGLVAVPPMCMVDDIMSIQKCTDASKINATINAFIELKKLRLSKDKCSRIHIGKQSASCPELKVHEHAMKNSEREKYLGDFVDKSGKIKPTIDDRVAKGWGIVSEIKAILNELPLGKYKLEIGLQLRQAMLVNGVLYNSEAWHCLNESHIEDLQKYTRKKPRSRGRGIPFSSRNGRFGVRSYSDYSRSYSRPRNKMTAPRFMQKRHTQQDTGISGVFISMLSKN